MRMRKNKDLHPRLRPSVARPRDVNTKRHPNGSAACRSRTVIEHVTARVVYQANEAEYVRIRCDDKAVHLVHAATGEPYQLLNQQAMSHKLFESMIARKLITRRVITETRHAFANVLQASFAAGSHLGEFVVLKIARTQPVRHASGVRPRGHVRAKPLKRLS